MALVVPKDGILSTETVHRRIRHRQTLFLGRACLADSAALVVVECAHKACFAAARAGVDELALGTRRAEPRVGLARAIYSDAEVYLLDDPLAAVDSKVSKNFENFKIDDPQQLFCNRCMAKSVYMIARCKRINT